MIDITFDLAAFIAPATAREINPEFIQERAGFADWCSRGSR